MARIEVDLREGMHFDGIGEEGTTVRLDASSEHGGLGKGFRPMEMLLVGLGSCTAMDVISILRKKRQEVASYRVEVTGEQAADQPKVFTSIRIRHILSGAGLSEVAVQRAIELSETKYCPAYAMLREAAQISTDYEIRPSQPTD